MGALGPLAFTPFANVYGRRPAYLVSVLIGFISALGCAKAKTFGTLVLARAFNGFGQSAVFGLGAGTVVDVFFMHERGKAMGIFTLALTSGAHLAPIVGGYVARDFGWRWCFWIGSILNGNPLRNRTGDDVIYAIFSTGMMFIVCLLFMPETIFDRPASELNGTDKELPTAQAARAFDSFALGEPFCPPPMFWKTYLNRLWITDLERPVSRSLEKRDFVLKPFGMLKYPSVTFPAIY
ncbi:hypothetical protein H0H87_002914 [Tephrocybe sp. NHM501043]|nr:hypothetical protein H0H87_002914 [Tephrocybe sp. NHM501043]